MNLKFNPYVPSGIAFPGMFIGRIDEIHAIEQALFQTKHSNPQHIIISGERGIGKSSLLYVADLIARGELDSGNPDFNFLTVSTDLAGIHSQGGIIKQIGRELRSKLRMHEKLQEKAKKGWEFLSRWEILGVKYNGKEDSIDPDQALDDLVALLVFLVESKSFDGVSVFLDEADVPPVEANLGEFVKILTERLAKQGCSQVCILLAGQAELVPTLRASHESSLRIFQFLNIGPLEEKERSEVVRHGIKTANEKNVIQTSVTDEAVQKISELSEGYPHFLQQFSYCAFDVDSDNTIDEDDVINGAYAENGGLAQLGSKYFNEMYFSKIWSEEYRKVLNFMATHGVSWVSRKQIVSGCEVKPTNIDNALSVLKEREIIVGNKIQRGLYRLPTNSFAAWILAIGQDKLL